MKRRGLKLDSVKEIFSGIIDKAFSRDTALQDINNGDRAEELLDNEIFKKAFTDIREQLKEQLATAPINNTEALVRLRYMLRAHEAFEEYLTNTIQNGKVSKKQLSEYK